MSCVTWCPHDEIRSADEIVHIRGEDSPTHHPREDGTIPHAESPGASRPLCPAHQPTFRSGEMLPYGSRPCLDMRIVVQDCTVPYLAGMARDGRRQVLRRLASVCSPDHECCSTSGVRWLIYPWIRLDGVE